MFLEYLLSWREDYTPCIFLEKKRGVGILPASVMRENNDGSEKLEEVVERWPETNRGGGQLTT